MYSPWPPRNQITAMAMLTLAVPALNERKWAKYYIIKRWRGSSTPMRSCLCFCRC